MPGIGPSTERQLWNSGLLDWHQVGPDNPFKIPLKRYNTIATYVRESVDHLENRNPNYFCDLLPAKEHWRIFPDFQGATAYIDIETTGMDVFGAEITTIALYDGREIKTYVQGRNLHLFVDDILKYNVLVTYNGKTFDVPFIENQFRITLDHAHIDLRYVLKSLGYSGGLKQCEKALGLDRGQLDGVDGMFAVFLWRDYQQNGNERALETLLAYNIEDVVNLETLMVLAYNMKIKETPFYHTHELTVPESPVIPFKPDLETIDRIKRKMFRSHEYGYHRGF